jgi:hypothetical protein
MEDDSTHGDQNGTEKADDDAVADAFIEHQRNRCAHDAERRANVILRLAQATALAGVRLDPAVAMRPRNNPS